MKFSQVPALGVRACMSSSTPWSLSVLTHKTAKLSLLYIGTVSVAFNSIENFGTPNKRLFDAQSLCPHAPLPTLRLHPHGCRRTARGGGGG